VQPLPGEIAFAKTRYSCFQDTPLEKIIAERGISTLLLTGIATNVCVEITMRDSFQRDLWTILVSDCTASRTAEEQERAVKDAERNWGLVVTSDQVIAEWARPTSR
jgi:ureidoacrylate peracid hydrolase